MVQELSKVMYAPSASTPPLISMAYLAVPHITSKFIETQLQNLESSSKRGTENNFLHLLKFFLYGFQADSSLFTEFVAAPEDPENKNEEQAYSYL